LLISDIIKIWITFMNTFQYIYYFCYKWRFLFKHEAFKKITTEVSSVLTLRKGKYVVRAVLWSCESVWARWENVWKPSNDLPNQERINAEPLIDKTTALYITEIRIRFWAIRAINNCTNFFRVSQNIYQLHNFCHISLFRLCWQDSRFPVRKKAALQDLKIVIQLI